MASSSSSFASLSRRLLCRPLLPRPLLSSSRFFSTPLVGDEPDSDDFRPDADQSTSQSPSSSPRATPQQRLQFQRPLENGLDPGVYKAILIGKVGQRPVQKLLKSGRGVVLFSLGTGGIRNNRRPLENEDPRDYADRCAVQWHRVCVYRERLGNLALKHVMPG
ncbi:putative Single-stranded DNA-binding protein, mitochondrial [Cocos nucifera]|uniref:Putative Single-stranded DNA-binding protein, mitochondrial n=1 Tax=Cocos nucifera TaxID=13894 RepID=A0A8K0IBJ6_COCNU|nr:putative Single-stranded DNA-binding protein, mitochondrial [Cocos nucifera]